MLETPVLEEEVVAFTDEIKKAIEEAAAARRERLEAAQRVATFVDQEGLQRILAGVNSEAAREFDDLIRTAASRSQELGLRNGQLSPIRAAFREHFPDEPFQELLNIRLPENPASAQEGQPPTGGSKQKQGEREGRQTTSSSGKRGDEAPQDQDHKPNLTPEELKHQQEIDAKVKEAKKRLLKLGSVGSDRWGRWNQHFTILTRSNFQNPGRAAAETWLNSFINDTLPELERKKPEQGPQPQSTVPPRPETQPTGGPQPEEETKTTPETNPTQKLTEAIREFYQTAPTRYTLPNGTVLFDYFEIFGVEPPKIEITGIGTKQLQDWVNSSQAAIKKKYRQLSKSFHPDSYSNVQGGSLKAEATTILQLINEAYETLHVSKKYTNRQRTSCRTNK